MLLDVIRRKARISVDMNDAIATWAWRWAAMLQNRTNIDSDGSTPYARAKGRACRMELVPLGERVMYLTRSPSRNTVEGRLRAGIWLGRSRVPNEYWIGTPDGVTLTSTVRRMSAEEAWNGEALKTLSVKVEDATRRLEELRKVRRYQAMRTRGCLLYTSPSPRD